MSVVCWRTILLAFATHTSARCLARAVTVFQLGKRAACHPSRGLAFAGSPSVTSEGIKDFFTYLIGGNFAVSIIW